MGPFVFLRARGFGKYVKTARKILASNWTGRYTRPSPGLYPHQWNWDSAFIAMGYAHEQQERAQQELRSLFEAQWPNGMIPQIVFHPDHLGHYFPEPDFWQVPGGRLTSGITMPPLHAIASMHIYRHARRGASARAFLEWMYPRLVAAHRYLYRHRDPDRSGLVHIRHPWESGLDNSPAWDGPLKRMTVEKGRLPPYRRRDLEHGVPAAERPSDEEYDRYVYLVDLFRRVDYDEALLARECPFRVQDVLFNSILCRANRDLLEMGRILGRDTGRVREWAEATSRAIARDLWCPRCGRFESLDAVSGGHLHKPTAAGFMPLFAGAVDKERALRLYRELNSVSFCALRQGNCFTVPNYDMTREDFDARNYWRGPVWININWMLARGLADYGFREKADAMKKDMIQLPVRFGFHEYFDSRTGRGYGSDAFSWTCSLFIDLVHEYYDEDKHRYDGFRPGRGRRLRTPRVLNETRGAASPPADPAVAGRLMKTLGELRDRFFDNTRGIVDYEALGASRAFAAYCRAAESLQTFDPRTLRDEAQRKAFWINLYNALVVHGIVALGVKASVREIPDFFKRVSYRVGEVIFSAEDLEHGILRGNRRPPYRPLRPFGPRDERRRFALAGDDPRIHFALVCGSRSCAPIRFYEPECIDEQLDRATRNFVNSSEVLIVPEKNKIFLSQIFSWYRRDFGGREKIFDFLLKHLHDPQKAEYLKKNRRRVRVESLFYDWNLNH